MSKVSKNKIWLTLKINSQNLLIKPFFSLGRCKQHVLKHAFNSKERWDELSHSLAINKRESALQNLQRLGCHKQTKDCQICGSAYATNCTKELWPFINDYEKIIRTTLLESSKLPRYLLGTTAGGQSSIYFLCHGGVLTIASLRGQCYNVATAYRSYPLVEANPGLGYLDWGKSHVRDMVEYHAITEVKYMAGADNWGFDNKGKVRLGQTLSEEIRTKLQRLRDETAKRSEDESKSKRKRKRKRESTNQPE